MTDIDAPTTAPVAPTSSSAVPANGRMVFAAVAGISALVGAASAAWAGLQHQAGIAARAIGDASTDPPRQDGVYLPDGAYVGHDDGREPAEAFVVAMLGDSTSAGFGADGADGLPGVMLARAMATELGTPVRLVTHAVVGSRSADLSRQAGNVLADQPDLVVIVVGANDVRDKVSPAFATQLLVNAIGFLRDHDIPVVVGSCPDLGVIEPIPQPLRQLAGSWSRRLAAMQERAAVKAGARAVSISRLVSPDFRINPDFFSPDRFHPSGLGYRRAVQELLPPSLEAARVASAQHPGAASGPSRLGLRP